MNYSASTRWTNEIAIDPSPTADATRLMLPRRTSPTANTPGRDVSSRYGERSSGHRAAARSSCVKSGPVLMKPFSSSVTRPVQPSSIRLGPGHQEYVPDFMRRDCARAVAPLHTFQMSASLESHDLGSRAELDRRSLLDAADQVARHALGKAVGPNEQMHSLRRLRQEYRCLTGRVGPSDDDDLIAAAELPAP